MIHYLRKVVQQIEPETPYKVFSLSTLPSYLLIQEMERRIRAGAIRATPRIRPGDSQRLVIDTRTHTVRSHRTGPYLIQFDVDKKDDH